MSNSKDFISLPNRSQSLSQVQQIDICWKDLSVTLSSQQSKNNTHVTDIQQPLIPGEQYILNNLTGYAKSGEMTAIMGPSGAGKTTLVACLSNRFKATSKTSFSGEVTANGQSYSNYNDFGAFVMQDDLLMATLTVRETLLFVANLRIQGSEFEKLSRVDQVIKDLNLRNCQNTFIGDGRLIKGVSGGERKRTSIGVEMISDPPVLILDEPTSGLDSFTAFICMNILSKLAHEQKRTVIFTIHQPSIDIYNLFDRLLLLDNGQAVYFGAASQLMNYCEQIDLKLTSFSNPIDSVMNNLNKQSGQVCLINHNNYEKYISQDIASYMPKGSGYLARRKHTSFITELLILANRQFLNYVRNPNLLKSKILGAAFMGLFLGYLFWDVGGSQPPLADEKTEPKEVIPYLQNMTGAMFVCGTSAIFSALGPLLMLFPIERTIFLKEENSKLYGIGPYYMSKIMLEVPMNILIQLVLSFWLYYAFSLRWQFESVLVFLIVSVSTSLCGNGIGIFTGCLFADPKKSASLGPIVLLPLQLFGGQQVVLDGLPAWVSWIQYISPFKYFLEAFGRSQLEDVRFNVCDPQSGFCMILDPMEYYGRTTGLWTCVITLVAIAVGFHILGGVSLRLLVRKLNV